MSSPTPTPSACQINAENDRILVLRRFWLSTALFTATVMRAMPLWRVAGIFYATYPVDDRPE
ncbi:MAG: hypothetical protein M0Z43_04085 [Acidithiobacillus sp.]|jgi:DHA2 family multidrug resistance protein|nr:hypothetical protein [Acidithiobacillus sp.]